MKKITLASCVLAASLSTHAELQPLSEFDLHNVTGQAGIDIELDVEIDIGEILYVDTAEAGDGDGGGLSIKDLHIGGGEGRAQTLGLNSGSNTARIDNFKFAIDVASDGELIIDGQPTSGGIGVVDFHLGTGAISTTDINGDEAVRLIDSINMWGGAAYFKMNVSDNEMVVAGNTVNYTNLLIRTQFGVDELDIDASSSLGIKVEDAVIAGKEYFEQIEEDGSPYLTGRLATLRANIYQSFDQVTGEGNGIVVDMRTSSSSTNVFDIMLSDVQIGGSSIGSVAIDNLDLGNIYFTISGH